MQGNNIDLNDLTFEPQTTKPETIHISFTEGNNTAFVVGKTVQGKLNISANNKTITKNISMTAAGVYQAGVNDARANHITWTPITPALYDDRNIIATRNGNVQTYGNSNNKYIQVQFALTADHLNSNNESTYPYTIPNDDITSATFNVDVTDLINSSGTISVSELDIISATNYNASSSTNTEITGSNSISENSNGTVTATGAIKVNNKSYYSNVPLDITGIVEDLYLRRKNSISVRDYNSTTHRLYLTSHYEVRLDNGGTSTLILDVYDKGDNNSVDISNYISSSSGIDINDVRLYLTQASNVSDDYYTGISMTAGNLTYDPDNDRLIGYANAFLDTGTNTEQDSRRVKIIMSASKKPGSGGTISHSITKATGSNWSSTVKQYNFTVNDSNAGNVRIYKDGNIIKGAYANSSSESYSYDDLFTISSGGTTINTTGVNRVLSGSTYKEAYQSGNSWYIDVKPTVNGTEYTTVPINVSDVYTKGYNANQGTVGSWSYTIEDKDTVYEEDPLTLSFGSEVNYYNGYLYGNVNIKHGTYSQRFTVSMSTEDVPTGGDTPSSGSYARTGQNFYVDEQSYDYGYSYNGSSSKVAITGYVEVDGHRVDVNSFDIGVGSIWYDGYQAGGGGSGSTGNYGYHRLSFSRYYEPGTGWKWSYSLYIYDTNNNYLASESGDVTQTN